MKLLSRLAIALAICLMAIPMMATPVQAAEYITLRPSHGNIGDKVYITGSGFNPAKRYWVYYEIDHNTWEEVLDRYDCDVDEEGRLETEKFEIPESY